MVIAYILIVILLVSVAYQFHELSKTKDRLEILEREDRVFNKEIGELKAHNAHLTDSNSMLRDDVLRLEGRYEYLSRTNENLR